VGKKPRAILVFLQFVVRLTVVSLSSGQLPFLCLFQFPVAKEGTMASKAMRKRPGDRDAAALVGRSSAGLPDFLFMSLDQVMEKKAADSISKAKKPPNSARRKPQEE
jgi:hypothetical protein